MSLTAEVYSNYSGCQPECYQTHFQLPRGLSKELFNRDITGIYTWQAHKSEAELLQMTEATRLNLKTRKQSTV